MLTVFVGTSGYSYADWHGPFYPESLSAQNRLDYYASKFAWAEINYSYYRAPRFQAVERLVAAVPEGFPLVFKAHRSLTHDRAGSTKTVADRVRAFIEPLAPLSGHLTPAPNGVLLQFPFSFAYTTVNRRYLASLIDHLLQAIASEHMRLELFVEFRKRDWQNPSTMRGLADRNINHVMVDVPRIGSLPHSFYLEPGSHHRILYLRFHGRNTDTWWNGTNATRYEYDYSDDELRNVTAELFPRLAGAGTEILYVAFNNHFRGNAPKNGSAFASLISPGANPALPITYS